MSYLHYVIAAYAVFCLALIWDWLDSRWQVGRALCQALARRERRRSRVRPAATDVELQR